MKNFGLGIFFIAFCFNLFAQEYNRLIVDPKTQKEILIGYCTKEGLLESEFNKHFDANYEKYQFVPETIEALNIVLEGVKIIVVMGVWCKDSQREIPRFIKIIDHLIYPQEEINWICVDSKMNAEDVPIEEYKIEKVPTFIFMKDDIELGRIVEKPKESLEKDILDLIKSDK
ncbi:thioredoxin family protein [candidate division KSB1 bacterium]